MTIDNVRINMPGFTVDITRGVDGKGLRICNSGKGDSVHTLTLDEHEALWELMGASKVGDALAKATMEVERLRTDLATAEAKLAVTETKLSMVRGTLRIFRDFVNANAKVWQMGAGVCHHPMWGMVCEALGSVNSMRTTPIEWQFIYAENRRTLGEIE
jgi:hypothetical protein